MPLVALQARSKEAGRSISHAWGRATAGQRMLPNTLIVGAQRCGTTALFRAITAHPAASGPVLRKGVHYFDVDYTRSLEWYQGWFPRRSAVTRDLPDELTPVVLEASPYYMFHPAAPERMARDLPGVRVIALLRDPVERALSAYKHERARGYETLSLADALDAEPERLAGEESRLQDPAYVSFAHQHQGYVARGRYAEQLERLEATLGRERILVLDSARYFASPDESLAGVMEFLGLTAIPHGEVFRNESAGRSGADEDLRARLQREFEPHDERLRDWLGWTPTWMT